MTCTAWKQAFGAACSLIAAVGLLGDGPNPPPPKPAPPNTYVGAGGVGTGTTLNQYYGNQCLITDVITIKAFSVKIPRFDKSYVTNVPDYDATSVTATPAYFLPVKAASLASHVAEFYQNCHSTDYATKLQFLAPREPKQVDIFAFTGGTYSTADGTISLGFIATGSAPFSKLKATFSGTFTAFSQSGTMTFTRIDVRDPSLALTVAVPWAASYRAPAKGKVRPKPSRPIKVGPRQRLVR